MQTTLLPCIVCGKDEEMERLGERSVLRHHGFRHESVTRFTEVAGRCTVCGLKIVWCEPLTAPEQEPHSATQAMG